ncbi:MAG: filamentous hemagglutinin family protein [Lachnospiraceae bacterium]|jgi:hypothetical protein|nr:filamentous hemagglutinin family protein [Lachnospiraceae bacterium]
MGAGQSDLYKGTYGDNPDNIPDALKGIVKFPQGDSQLKHMFRNEEGHLPDTPENRKLLYELANDEKYYVGKDMWGNDWHVRQNSDGTQDWVEHQNKVISDGGKNSKPKNWDDVTGLKYNPLRKYKDE